MNLPKLDLKLKSRDKVIIYSVATAAVIFLLNWLFFAPLVSKLKKVNQEIRVGEAKLRLGIGMCNKKENIKGQCDLYKPYLQVAGAASEREVITRFLKEIERVANDSGISVISLSPQSQPEQLKEAKKYKADLRAEAHPAKMFNFLSRMQNSGLMVELDKLSLAPKDEEASLVKLETTISIVAPSD